MEQTALNVQKLSLELSSPSDIYMGSGAARLASEYARGRKVFLVTDSNVKRLYAEWISASFASCRVHVFTAGEKRKNHKTLLGILRAMAGFGLTRKDLVIALGGGVVGDMAGLAASLYMRGVEVLQIPTTLLAQVDSSVGGKTAIDFCGVKNLIGAFYQPRSVYIDPMFLSTLPLRERVCGLGEIIKTATLDGQLFDLVCAQYDKNGLDDLEFLAQAAMRSVRVKARIVCEDEKETTGLRKTLNIGHTLGHAVEMCYRNRSHGQCVMWGMALELAASGAEVEAQYKQKLLSLLYSVAGEIPPFDVRRAVKIATHDKKNQNSSISMMVPVKRGEVTEVLIGEAQLERALAAIQNKVK